MKHPATLTLYSYWNGLRAGRIAPRRFEVEPARIGDALPDTFLLERRDGETYPFRLAGTRLCERFQKEFRGHNFLSSWTGNDAATLQLRLNEISMNGGVLVISAHADTAGGRSVGLEILIMPLLHGGVTADRYLGLVSPLEEPHWLGYDPIETWYLLSEDVVFPDGAAPVSGDHDEDRQTPFRPQVRHARIVRSNRRQFRVFDGGLASEPASGPGSGSDLKT